MSNVAPFKVRYFYAKWGVPRTGVFATLAEAEAFAVGKVYFGKPAVVEAA